MSKPIEKGSFVVHGAHPEHGLGRVLSMDGMATRVLFLHGGLRVFRPGDVGRLQTAHSPAGVDVDTLAAKEAAMAQGAREAPVGPPPKVAPPKKKSAKRKS